MLGFGALGEFALGEGAEAPPQPIWSTPSTPASDFEMTIVKPPPRIITD